MIAPYSVFVHLEAAEVARDLEGSDRDQIFHFARSLANNPFLESDRREQDRQGRPRDVKIVGRWAIVYHVDHAESEVRILAIHASSPGG